MEMAELNAQKNEVDLNIWWNPNSNGSLISQSSENLYNGHTLNLTKALTLFKMS